MNQYAGKIIPFPRPANDMMTSELVSHSASLEREDDAYGKEFIRRLGLIDLTDEQSADLYQRESLLLSYKRLKRERNEPWIRRSFFIDSTTINSIPRRELLTLSELILVTDDANFYYPGYAEIRYHKAVSKRMVAVCNATFRASNSGEAIYMSCFRERVQGLGWSSEQENAFIRNECLLTGRLKWNYPQREAWTAETTHLAEYERKSPELDAFLNSEF